VTGTAHHKPEQDAGTDGHTALDAHSRCIGCRPRGWRAWMPSGGRCPIRVRLGLERVARLAAKATHAAGAVRPLTRPEVRGSVSTRR